MFDGNFKAKRNINLGGNKQQIDKQRLLRQAQEERRIRELERRRLKAAEQIQAWYRGRRVAANIRIDARATWDNNIADFEREIQVVTNATNDSFIQRVQSLTLRLMFFFRASADHFRLARLARVLLSKHLTSQQTLLMMPLQSSSDSKGWTIALSRLLALALRHLGAYSPWGETESEAILKFIDVLTLAESFPLGKSSAVSTEYGRQFCQILFQNQVFLRLSHFLRSSSFGEKGNISTSLAFILSIRICKALDQTSDYPKAIDQFVAHILTIPDLPNCMSIETLTVFTSRFPLDSILQRLSSTSCAQLGDMASLEIVILAANIVAFSYQRVAKMSSVTSAAYLRVLTILLGLIPPESLEKKRKAQRDEDEDDDEEMDDGEWTSQAFKGSPEFRVGVSPKVMKWLSLAHDNNHLNDILGSLEPSETSQEILTPESIGQITQFLLKLITVFPSYRISILSNLMYFRFGSRTRGGQRAEQGLGNLQGRDGRQAQDPRSQSPKNVKFFGISIIKVFLDAFMDTSLYQQLIKSHQQDSTSNVQLVLDPKNASAWSLLAFISELYCQILATMGDDEFHDESRNPISISNVITLSSVLRDVAFLLWWNDNALNMDSNLDGSKNLKVGYLREITTELTRQLHARDSRRSFCPKDHWLLSTSLNMQSFQQAVILDAQSLSQQNDDGYDERSTVRPTLEGNSRSGQRSINRKLGSSQLARLSPRLGVLNNIPFVIKFEDRVAIFRSFVESDRQSSPGLSNFHPIAVGKAQVRRGSVFEDGYEQLNPLGRKLKGRIAIEFVDQYGITEAGIDGGGVFKEFLTSLVHQAFDTNYGLFLNTSDHLLYPNPHSFASEMTQLKHYEFLGRILGKALYEGILIDAAFAGFFLSKCLGQVNYLDDLPSLDPELYRGLMFLKNYEGNVEDLSLFFTVDDQEMGTTITRELIPNGSEIAVTRENRIRYIYLTAHYRLNTQINRQCRAFFRGLSDLIDPKWLWMFNEQELQVMLGGAQTPISLDDLKKNVVYSNYEPSDPTIQFFWSVVEEMTEEDRRLLIKFVTSCSRPPLLGFAELNPKLCIRHAGVEEGRLPTSSTCMNLLKLPAFSTRERLKEKLLYAIHSEAGFDLS
ncbi:hypothetical protein BGZ94_004884 [Podila epigama]|nr:hypothetical protein BGZ94_004884 [Podila epigama]